MRKIIVGFSDLSVLEGSCVVDSHRFWRMVSRICKRYDCRVISVERSAV